MKTILLILAALAQLAVLAVVIARQEHLLATGRVVYLRTAPVDPRDIFRGDYVHLDYEVAKAGPAQFGPGIAALAKDHEHARSHQLYAALTVGDRDVAELATVTTTPPASGLYLRCRPENNYWSEAELPLHFGLEQYFVQQDTGHALEDRMGSRTTMQVPLEMAIAVAPDGRSAIKGYRWSALGMSLAIELDPAPPAPADTQVNLNTQRPLKCAVITLLNATDHDLAIVDSPRHPAFTLEPATAAGGDPAWRWVHDPHAPGATPAPANAPQAEDVHLLAPGKTYELRIDLHSPEWYAVPTRPDVKPMPLPAGTTPPTETDMAAPSAALPPGAVPLGRVGWGGRFRFVYHPPPPAAVAALPHADLIWHGRFPSRAFVGSGSVD